MHNQEKKSNKCIRGKLKAIRKALQQRFCDFLRVEFPAKRFFPLESWYLLVVLFAVRFLKPRTGPLSKCPRAELFAITMVGFIEGEE